MIKRLYIIRHAKAEDLGYSSALKDIERNLVSQGIMQSAKLGKLLHNEQVKIDVGFSSPANRAYETGKMVFEQMYTETKELILDDGLYGGGPRGYLACLNGIDEQFESAVMFGHNPDISYFAEYLTRDDVNGNMKKATLIELQFENQKWNEISGNSGNFVRRIDVADIKFD